MKKINKYLFGILFTLGLLFTGATLASAETITGTITITIVPVPPTLTTTAVTSITQTTAVSGGNIIDFGGATVTTRGVIWSATSSNPDISSNDGITSDGTGTGSFVSNLSSLKPGTPYYVRAYATNSGGTGYGATLTFTTSPGFCPAPTTQTNTGVACDPYAGVDVVSGSVTQTQTKNDYPDCTWKTPIWASDTCTDVTTTPVTSITQTTAVSGGNVISSIGGSVFSRGVVLSKNNQSPTISDYNGKTSDGTGTGSFVSSLSSLTPGTLYYVRAYATSTAGTAYGSVVTFTTSLGSCPAPLTQNITGVTCGPYNGVAAISGSVTQTQTKNDYPDCTWKTPIWASDTCKYLPIVTSPTCTNTTSTSVTIGANITSLGIPAAGAGGMCIDESTGTTGCSTSGISLGLITRNVTGLTPNTTYYYKGNAINSAGTGWSTAGSCTTLMVPPMSGTLVPQALSCIINTTDSSCNINLDWSITNPETNPTAITTNGMPDSIVTTATVNGKYTGTKSLPVPYTNNSPRIFYLYNNSKELAFTSAISSSCDIANGYIWSDTYNHCIIQKFPVTTSVQTDRGAVNVGGTISPTSQNVIQGSKATFTVTPATGYSIGSVYGCAGSLSGSTYTTGPITAACNVSVTFNTNFFPLTVTKTGTGGGIVSDGNYINCGTGLDCSHSYDYGTVVTLTATPNTNSIFTTWVGCDGITDGKCSVTIDSTKNVAAIFTNVTISVTASPTTYNVPTPIVSFTYTPTINTGSVECRLLNYDVVNPVGLTDWTANTSGTVNKIINLAPGFAGTYGYFVQCRSASNTAITATSDPIIVNVVQPSVVAYPLLYNVAPGASVPFTYTTSTVPSNIPASDPKVECKLVDYQGNDLIPASAYQSINPTSLSYAVPNSTPPGSFGYYVKCRNTLVNAATATSNKIIVNTSCGSQSVWNGSSCLVMLGTLTPHNCTLFTGETTCNAKLDWTITNPISTPTAITADGMTNINVMNLLTDPQSGTVDVSVTPTPKTFYLYNNGGEPPLAYANVMAVTGTLNATTCGGGGVPLGGGSCQITLSWDVKNGKTGVYPTIKDITNNKNITITSVFNGTVNYNISLGNTSSKSTDFELWYGDSTSPLAEASAIAFCSNSKTKVVGGKCILKDAEIISFESIPTTIFKGKTATLKWVTDPELVKSCTITSPTSGENVDTGNKANGVAPVTPKVTTTYTLTCVSTKDDDSQNAIRTTATKVVDVTIKEN